MKGDRHAGPSLSVLPSSGSTVSFAAIETSYAVVFASLTNVSWLNEFPSVKNSPTAMRVPIVSSSVSPRIRRRMSPFRLLFRFPA